MLIAIAPERRVDIAAALAAATARLLPVSESPRLDAEILLAECCGFTRSTIFGRPELALDAESLVRFERAVDRRASGEPVAYITGRREFWSLPLAVTPAVLVPRPETELAVEVCLELLGDGAGRVLDLGTGSGAIALALKASRPVLTVVGADRSAAALDVAHGNARASGLEVTFVESDWFSALAGQRFDLIVCNPPYVRSGDPHFDGPLRHEPRAALDGGPDGLAACRAVLGGAAAHLCTGGWVVLEHGHDQRAALVALGRECGLRVVAVRDDLAGRPRVMVLRRAAAAEPAQSTGGTAGRAQ